LTVVRIITIDREYGAGGGEIASKLAARLGWKLWDQLLTNAIAAYMKCDCRAIEEREEQRDPLRYRLFKAFLRGSFEGTINAQQVKMVDADCIREATERVVLDAAKEGNCVIVGRGSVYYLQSEAEAFHVFVYAATDEKVRRLQRKTGYREDEAAALVDTVDRDRAAYIKQYFEVEWPARNLYHLMINSAAGDEAAVQTILGAVAALQKAKAAV
jgi:cytidylate kinase